MPPLRAFVAPEMQVRESFGRDPLRRPGGERPNAVDASEVCD